jgi:hypothetical protein
VGGKKGKRHKLLKHLPKHITLNLNVEKKTAIEIFQLLSLDPYKQGQNPSAGV